MRATTNDEIGRNSQTTGNLVTQIEHVNGQSVQCDTVGVRTSFKNVPGIPGA